MKHGVGRQTLVVTAGIVWMVAGFNILRIGLMTWTDISRFHLFPVCEAIVVFLLFFNLVFKQLFYKHTKRIEQKRDNSCPFSFFDVKGWIVMLFMISFGVLVRKFHLLPDAFISVFYVGLSCALIFTGFWFLRYAWRRKRLNSQI